MGSILKDLSILKKFLFINLIVFVVIGILTIVYLKATQPDLIKKKTSNHIKVIDNYSSGSKNNLSNIINSVIEYYRNN